MYLDPATYALVGYRFFYDEAAIDGRYNDGACIALEGEVSASAIRLLRERRWHANADDRFLGADITAQYEVVGRGPASAEWQVNGDRVDLER
jgi:hypothetical protein